MTHPNTVQVYFYSILLRIFYPFLLLFLHRFTPLTAFLSNLLLILPFAPFYMGTIFAASRLADVNKTKQCRESTCQLGINQ